MIIGVPRETKDNECRVASTPACVEQLVEAGHGILVEEGAGVGSGISDREFEKAGAKIVPEPAALFAESELILKVKEPLPSEFDHFQEGQILFTFLHLAANKPLTEFLIAKKITAIAYETIEAQDGALPILVPMSEIAGRMAVQAGAYYLESHNGGKGVLLSGVPGVRSGEVVIIGAGIVGANAARIARAMGARVTVIDKNPRQLKILDDRFAGTIMTLTSIKQNIANAVAKADLLIGAVLVPGAKAPKIVTREMIRSMEGGSVIVDVAVDQGGCIETTRPTSHSDPVYEEENVIHYAVTNIPGAVARTSTFALTSAALPYVTEIADLGLKRGMGKLPWLPSGINTIGGHLTHPTVAQSLSLPYTAIGDVPS
ncbi:MAG: alanine dehydrogenase [bacterium]|nr:alanine dehydrogenase [bacterium]